MSERPGEGDRFRWSWEAHHRDQALSGLRLTPAERLRWLEETMDGMRRWLGRARTPREPET